MTGMFGIYIHWPFCASKCPYCDFNSHVAATIDHAAWRDAYAKELRYYASLTSQKEVTSVFFGGGTPSLMQPETVESVINQIQKSWTVSDNIEITLEANPTSVELEKFEDFKKAGVNRVSVGIQSLRDDQLQFLGRKHSAMEGIKAIDMAQKTFDRYSFDLIYARPNQTCAEWESELREALEYADKHLSLYQLTIEPGTAFHTMYERKDFLIPDDELGGQLFEITQSIMEEHGLPAYEVSNHAAVGHESQHNLTYWRYGEYIGVGPGAHGRITLNGSKTATRAHRAPDVWMQRVTEHGHGAHPFEELTQEQAFQERVMMGLRLREGIAIDGFDSEKIMMLTKEGLIEAEEKKIRPTIAGLQRLNGIIDYLL